MTVTTVKPLEFHYHVGKDCNRDHKIQCYDNIDSNSSRGSVNDTLSDLLNRTVRCTWIFAIANCVICANTLDRSRSRITLLTF